MQSLAKGWNVNFSPTRKDFKTRIERLYYESKYKGTRGDLIMDLACTELDILDGGLDPEKPVNIIRDKVTGELSVTGPAELPKEREPWQTDRLSLIYPPNGVPSPQYPPLSAQQEERLLKDKDEPDSQIKRVLKMYRMPGDL
jgi:hypothetical protein